MPYSFVLLHHDANRAPILAELIANDSIQVTIAENVNDCIRKLTQSQVDLLVVDAGLTKPSALEFLAKAREKIPWTPRALYAESTEGLDPFAYINGAGICSVLTPPINTAPLMATLDNHQAAEAKRRVPPPSDSSEALAELEALRARNTALEEQLKKTERDLRIARNADLMIKESEMDVASLKVREANEKLGVELSIDYTSNNLEGELIKALRVMLEAPGLQLPVMPQITLDLQKMMEAEDVAFGEVAELIKSEAALASRVLSLCNSPVFAGPDPIASISQAVTRLGVEALRDLVQTVALEGMFQTSHKGMEDLMAKLWMHSLATAHANQLVSEMLGIEDTEDFFAAGLLHDIGKFFIVSMIQQGFDLGLWNTRIVTPTMALKLVQTLHNDLGAALLTKWGYPEIFIDVATHHNTDADIHTRSEAVVVTYYSNALTRKLGHSLVAHKADVLSNHELAQALNMDDKLSTRIEQSAQMMVERIQKSYF